MHLITYPFSDTRLNVEMLLQNFFLEAQHRIFRVGSKAFINGITSDKVIVDMLYYSGIEKQATKRGSF